jgi:DNA repair photolyase
LKIGETTCKTIINKSGIEGVDYAVNPYIGCTHGCTYCYAKFMTRWYHGGEKWGSFVDVKKNAIDCLTREVNKRKKGVILFSSVTDAYQPVEKKYKITRGLLEKLVEHDFPVEILTKSALVTRDSDIIDKFDHVEVGMTITSNDENVRRAFEPGASPVAERMEALKLYSNMGIPTFAFLGPLLPFLSELELEKLLNVLSDRVGRVLVDRLNIKAGNWNNIEQTLIKYYPEMLKDFKKASKDPSEYYIGLKAKVRRMLDERAIPYDILF